MQVRVTYKNEFLGEGTFDRFSEGDGVFSDPEDISNICAKACAKDAMKTGQPVTWGMWTATPYRQGSSNNDPES